MCADFLAKLGTRSISDLMTIVDPLTELRLLLITNNLGVSYPRGY